MRWYDCRSKSLINQAGPGNASCLPQIIKLKFVKKCWDDGEAISLHIIHNCCKIQVTAFEVALCFWI